jgi:protein kinase C substrate 80K-H
MMSYHTDFGLEAAAALRAFNDAEGELSKLRSNKKETEETLTELFDPRHYGAQGEWKKLENLCLEREFGE